MFIIEGHLLYPQMGNVLFALIKSRVSKENPWVPNLINYIYKILVKTTIKKTTKGQIEGLPPLVGFLDQLLMHPMNENTSLQRAMDSAIRKAKLIRNIGTDSCLVLGGHKTARMDLGKEATWKKHGFQIYIKSFIKRPSKKLKRVKSKVFPLR